MNAFFIKIRLAGSGKDCPCTERRKGEAEHLRSFSSQFIDSGHLNRPTHSAFADCHEQNHPIAKAFREASSTSHRVRITGRLRAHHPRITCELPYRKCPDLQPSPPISQPRKVMAFSHKMLCYLLHPWRGESMQKRLGLKRSQSWRT